MITKSRIAEIEDILKWKDEKPEIKKKMNNLSIGEKFCDQNTQTRYERIAQDLNSENITAVRSSHVGRKCK